MTSPADTLTREDVENIKHHGIGCGVFFYSVFLALAWSIMFVVEVIVPAVVCPTHKDTKACVVYSQSDTRIWLGDLFVGDYLHE